MTIGSIRSDIHNNNIKLTNYDLYYISSCYDNLGVYYPIFTEVLPS